MCLVMKRDDERDMFSLSYVLHINLIAQALVDLLELNLSAILVKILRDKCKNFSSHLLQCLRTILIPGTTWTRSNAIMVL